jgi:ubiquinone/menaquinone biosynthesis C-methylase UbiE
MDKQYAKYLLERVQGNYNLIAKDFSRTRDRPWYEIRFLFSDYLFAGDKVLDLGCGNGRNLIYFKEKIVDYYGVDYSSRLIKIAKEKYPEENFRVGNALNLSFANNFFDKVYSIAVLHQIPSKSFRLKFLKEVKRVLRPKGLVVLTVWNLYRKEHILSVLKNYFLKLFGKTKLGYRDILVPWGDKTERYYHFFSQKELKNLVEKAGLKVIKQGVAKSDNGSRQNLYIIAQKE